MNMIIVAILALRFLIKLRFPANTPISKIINDLTPRYTKEPIPPLQQPNYSLRNQDVIGQIRGRTEKFLSSFYPNCISEWNRLDPEVRLAPSVCVFKTKLLSKNSPQCKVCLLPHSHCMLNQLKLNQVFEWGLLIGQCNKSSHLIG